MPTEDAADTAGCAGRGHDAHVLLNASPAPIIVSDLATRRVLWVNDAAVHFYGYDRPVFLTLRIDDFRVERSAGEIEGWISKVGTPEFDAVPRVHRTASGDLRTVKVTASHLLFDGHEAMVVAVTDVTELHRMQDEVRRARNFLRQVIDQIPTAVFVKDMEDGRRFVIYNKASENLFGRSSADALGSTDDEVFGQEAAARFAVQDEVALRLGATATVEDESVSRPDGSTRHVRTRKVALADGGRPRFVVGVCDDVTDRRADEARIAHMAHHDGLTDLPNRFLFQDRLASALARCSSVGEMLAVLCVDLDGFKAVNDTWGHAVGDRLLQAVAGRLRGAVRGSDTAARLGGDEFAVLQAPIVGLHEAAGLAERLVQAVAAPYVLDGRRLAVSTSVGVAIGSSRGTGTTDLLERADAALYQAKREGRNTFRLADADR